MKIPILTYHSANVAGTAYDNNDHVALAQDLRLINDLGFKIIPAHWLVAWLAGDHELSANQKYLAITFDDGVEMDYFDWHHPAHGLQRGFRQIMGDFVQAIGADTQATLHASAFVIASPVARAHIEQVSLAGNKIMGESWWQNAHADEMFSIECHSWDHNHGDLPESLCGTRQSGCFDVVDDFSTCDLEIRQASDYIGKILGPGKATLLAYPWGQYSAYMVEEYLPKNAPAHGLVGAFDCSGKYLTKASNCWTMPRFVCGDHWRAPHELRNILLAANDR